MVRDNARRFCEDKLLVRVRDDFRHERFDPSVLADMGAMGFLGATLPEEEGGAGLSYVSYGLIAREVERIDSGYRSHDERAERTGDVPDLGLWQRCRRNGSSSRSSPAAK